MNTCCATKLRAVVVLLDMRDMNYKKLEKQLNRKLKKNEGQVDSFEELFTQHLTVLASRKELEQVKELIQMLIKDGWE